MGNYSLSLGGGWDDEFDVWNNSQSFNNIYQNIIPKPYDNLVLEAQKNIVPEVYSFSGQVSQGCLEANLHIAICSNNL